MAFLRRHAGGGGRGVIDVETRSLALAALDELLRRMLENAATSGAYEGGSGAIVIAKKSGGARQVILSSGSNVGAFSHGRVLGERFHFYTCLHCTSNSPTDAYLS